MTDSRRRVPARPTIWKRWSLGVALACFMVGVPDRATPGLFPDPEREPAKLEIEALPYGWIPGMYGSLEVDGNTVDIDVTPNDLLQIVFDGDALAGAGYFAASYDRFFLFSDTFGGGADLSVDETIPTQLCCELSISAKAKLRFVIADFALGYRLGRWSLPNRQRPLTLGVYAGARYMWFSSDVSATAGVVHGVQKSANVSDTFAWADPLIGVQWSAPLLDWLSLDFRSDIGGFGASSDLVWGLASIVKIWLPWTPTEALHPYAALGYRVVAFDRSSGEDEIDLQFRGPVLGAGFVF